MQPGWNLQAFMMLVDLCDGFSLISPQSQYMCNSYKSQNPWPQYNQRVSNTVQHKTFARVMMTQEGAASVYVAKSGLIAQ